MPDRLSALLERCRDARVVVVTAPSGAGKTTLADLLARDAATGLRVQLEPADRTLARVTARLVTAAGRVGLDAVVGAASRDDEPPDTRWAAALAALARHPGPVTLALDDAHHVEPGLIERLAAAAPDGVRLVLTRRHGAEQIDGAEHLERPDLDAVVPGAWAPASAARALCDELAAQGLPDLAGALGVLPAVSAPLARALGDPSLLARLDRLGVPLTTLPHPGWWRLHDGVRDQLRTHGDLPTTDAVIAARVYADAALILEAVDVLAAVGRLADLPDLVATQRPEVLDAVDLQTLASVLDTVARSAPPESSARAYLTVAHTAGSRLQHRLEGRLLDRAARHVDDTTPGPVTRRLEAVLMRHHEWELGSSDEARARIAAAERLIDTCSDEEFATRAVLRQVQGTLAAWTRQADLRPRAQAWLGESAALHRLAGDPRSEAAARIALAYRIEAPLGHHDRAISLVRDALSAYPPSSQARAHALTLLAELAITVAADDLADASLDEAIRVGRLLGDDVSVGYAAWERARLAALTGDPTASDHWIGIAEAHPGDWLANRAGTAFLAQQVEWAADHQRLSEARRRMVRVRDHAAAHGYPGQLLIAEGSLAALEGRFDDARSAWEQALADGSFDDERWRGFLLLGWVALQCGDHGQARLRARAVETELAAIGHPELAMLRETVRWPALAALLENPDLDEVAVPTPHRLVRVLGEVAVEGDGGTHPVPGDKPRHLVALVALAGRPMTADEIADRLWPGLDLEVARRRLRNVVSRVRAVDPVVEREGDRLRLAAGVTVDADHFAATAERVLSRAEPDSVDRQITEARAALTLWTGPLAVPADAGGLDLAAARLDRLWAGLLARIVSASIRAGDTDGAVSALEELAAADPYNDEYADRASALLRAADRPVEAARFDRLAAATRAALTD